MKRFLRCFLICMLAFVMLSSSASADSLFGLLQSESEEEEKPQTNVAPSYGEFASVMADEETENKAGDMVVTYLNVSAQQMEKFGKQLQDQKYQVLEQETQGETTAYKLSNDIFTFTLFYDKANQSLRAVYPKGTEYAKSLFPGYTKVKLGETFKIPGLGEFTFNSMQVCESVAAYGYDGYGKLYKSKKITFSGYLIEFTYYNTSTSNKMLYVQNFSYYFNVTGTNFYSDFFTVKFVYQNADDTYQYTPHLAGFYNGEYLRCDADYWYLPSLETGVRAITFSPPTGVMNSTDGTLAMTMDFPNGEKYVLMLRENGVDLY